MTLLKTIGCAAALALLASASHAQTTEAPATEKPATEKPAAEAVQSSPDTVVAKVGATEITQGEVDAAVGEMGQRVANLPPAQARARALDALIDTYVMADLARKDGLENDPDFKKRMKQQEDRTLQALYFGKKIQPSITDEAVKAAYESQLKNVTPKQEVRARHILLKTEEEAKAVIAELEGGADFAEVAKAKSTGPSGPRGGDLGFFGQGQMVPEFEQAAFALEPGGVTKEPVKTQFGFHVIKVEEKRASPVPPLRQVEEQVRANLLREAYMKAIADGREAVGVEITDKSYELPQQ